MVSAALRGGAARPAVDAPGLARAASATGGSASRRRARWTRCPSASPTASSATRRARPRLEFQFLGPQAAGRWPTSTSPSSAASALDASTAGRYRPSVTVTIRAGQVLDCGGVARRRARLSRRRRRLRQGRRSSAAPPPFRAAASAARRSPRATCSSSPRRERRPRRAAARAGGDARRSATRR